MFNKDTVFSSCFLKRKQNSVSDEAILGVVSLYFVQLGALVLDRVGHGAKWWRWRADATAYSADTRRVANMPGRTRGGDVVLDMSDENANSSRNESRRRKTNASIRSSVRRLFGRDSNSDSLSDPNGDLDLESTSSVPKQTRIGRLREIIARVIDSRVVTVVSILLAILDLCFFVTWFVFLLENTDVPEMLNIYRWVDWITGVAFLTESLLRLYSYGPKLYFRSAVRIIDMFISTVNFSAIIALHMSDAPPTWLEAVHLVRLMRIVMNMAKVRERALKWRARTELDVLQQQLNVERSDQGRLSKWRIDSNSIAIGESAGTGAFGAVHLGLFRGTLVAVKQLYETDMEANTASIEDEAITLVDLRHPNVVLFMGFVHEPRRLWIVTEYCSRGSLRDVLDDNRVRLTHARILKFALGAARGLAYLHGQQPIVLHRDLKPSNMLISSGWDIKLADFGLARRMDARPVGENVAGSAFAGTMQYCAPEIFQANTFSTAADIYAFAVCLWEMAARDQPFKGLYQMDIIRRVAENGDRPPLSIIQDEREREAYMARMGTSDVVDDEFNTMAVMRSLASKDLQKKRTLSADLQRIAGNARRNRSSQMHSTDSDGMLRDGSDVKDRDIVEEIHLLSPVTPGSDTNKGFSVGAGDGGKPVDSSNNSSGSSGEIMMKYASEGVGARFATPTAETVLRTEMSNNAQANFRDDEMGTPRRSASLPVKRELSKAFENATQDKGLSGQQDEVKKMEEKKSNGGGDDIPSDEATGPEDGGSVLQRRRSKAVSMCSEYCELIEQCWSQDPEERPTADEIVWRLVGMIDDRIRDAAECGQELVFLDQME